MASTFVPRKQALTNIRVQDKQGSLVLIIDGNSVIGAYVWSHLVYLICLRHLFRSGTGTKLIFFFLKKRPVFLNTWDTILYKYHAIQPIKGNILHQNSKQNKYEEKIFHSMSPLYLNKTRSNCPWERICWQTREE